MRADNTMHTKIEEKVKDESVGIHDTFVYFKFVARNIRRVTFWFKTISFSSSNIAPFAL